MSASAVIFVVCGNSLMFSSCWNEGVTKNLPPHFIAENAREKFYNEGVCRDYVHGKVSSCRHPLGDHGPQALVDSFNPLCWNDGNPGMWGKLPLELFSLKKIFNENNGKDKVKLVLLHSQDRENDPLWVQDEGDFCARVLEMILTQKLGVDNLTRKGFNYLSPRWENEAFLGAVEDLVKFVSSSFLKRHVNDKVVVDLSGAEKTTGLVLAPRLVLLPNSKVVCLGEEGRRFELSGGVL